jgi:para-nitrobenzyl esterase
MFEPLQLAPAYQLGSAERDGVAYGRSVGASSLAQLRALPAAALLNGKAGEISHPVVEPYVLPRSPYDVFAAGEQNDVAILIGSNADEARSLIPDLASVRAATFDADIAKRWGALPPPLLAAYPHATDAEAVRGRLDFERDLRFGWDIWAWARLQAMHGEGRVFYYQFTHAPPFPKASVYSGWGPSHFSELWYSFDHLGQEPSWAWTADDRALSDAMAGYWVNFARDGDPNGPRLVAWPRYTISDPRVMVLDEPLRAGPLTTLKTLAVFDAVYTQVRGAPFGSAPRP